MSWRRSPEKRHGITLAGLYLQFLKQEGYLLRTGDETEEPVKVSEEMKRILRKELMLMKKFRRETGKYPIWLGRITKQFMKWRSQNKRIKDDD